MEALNVRFVTFQKACRGGSWVKRKFDLPGWFGTTHYFDFGFQFLYAYALLFDAIFTDL